MFKKIEIWVLYLVLLMGVIVLIGYGALVKHEFLSTKSRFPLLSKSALFIAEIPENFKSIILGDINVFRVENRFPDISGFSGTPLEQEAYLLVSRYDNELKKFIVELIDLSTFNSLYSWNPDLEKIYDLIDKESLEFGNILNDLDVLNELWHPMLLEKGALLFIIEVMLIKVDKCSNVVWQNEVDWFHHSLERDYEGHYWVPTNMYPFFMDEEVVGSDLENYRDDAITKVSPSGEVVFQKAVSEIFIENNLEYLLYSGDGNRFNADPIHLNDIQPTLSDGPYWKKGDVFLSIRNQSMVMLYRPDDNKLIWKWTGHALNQHDVNILDSNRISIFNNNSRYTINGYAVDGVNEVIIYDFRDGSHEVYLNDSMEEYQVRTPTSGRGKILDNDDLFVEETDSGRMLYFNADGSLRWQYVNRSTDGHAYVLNWSRMIYRENELRLVRNLVSGNVECSYE